MALRRAPARDALAILVGRGRVTLLARGEERPVSLHGTRDSFVDEELRTLIDEYVGDRRLRGRVVVGVDPSLDFLAARRRRDGATDLVDELEERHGDRLMIEQLDAGRLGADLQRVYAAPVRGLREAAEAVRARGRVRIRFRSATTALQRLGESLDPSPASWSSEIRYYPGPRSGLAVFVCAGKVLTRQFLAADQDEEAMVAELAAMWTAVQDGLHLPPPAGIVLHCGEGGHALAAACRRAVGAEARVAPHLPFDQGTLCRALACEPRRRRGSEAHLFRALTEDVGGGEPARLPLPSLALTGAVLAMVAMMLQQTAQGLDAEIMALDARTRDAFKEYGRDPWALRDKRESLAKNAKVAEAFLMDRVYWADILGEVPGLLPDGVLVQRLEGAHPLHVPKGDDGKSGRRPDAYVELVCSVPVLDNATRIPQVPELTAALRSSQVFAETFRHVPNAEVNVRPDASDQVARVTVRATRSKR